MWLALKLLASGAFDGLMKGLSAALNWVTADWRNLAVAVLLPLLAWTGWITIPGLRADLAETRASLAAERAAHLGTVSAFLAASKQAQAEAEANVARVTAEQEIITDEVVTDLRGDLAAVTARFDRLRARNAAIDPGRADAAGLSGPGNAAGGIAGAPGDPDVRASRELTACPAALICLTIDQAERASQDAHRHNALIDWTTAQSNVRFTPEEPAE